MRAARVSMLSLLAALALAACGSSSSTVSFAKRSPVDILGASVTAVRATRSYVLSGSGSQNGTKLSVQLTYTGPKAVELGVVTSIGHIHIILADGQSYLNADATFWTKEANAAAAKIYANKWFKVSASQFGSLDKDITEASPADFATCLTKDVKNPKVLRTTSLDGASAVELQYTSQSGAASEIWISTTAPHYPLRVYNGENGSANGDVGICDSSGADGSGGTVNFSQWDAAPTVTAPRNAATLP